jgi:hypothetical protein
MKLLDKKQKRLAYEYLQILNNMPSVMDSLERKKVELVQPDTSYYEITRLTGVCKDLMNLIKKNKTRLDFIKDRIPAENLELLEKERVV